jgi:glycosyltransferase involved in cell wall biosynthesis
MDIIFLCGLFPRDRELEIYENSRNIVHAGPNSMQWAFVIGLKTYFKSFTIITTPLLTSFPLNYRKVIFRGSSFNLDNDINGYCLGSIRLPFLSLLSKFVNIFFTLMTRYYSKTDVRILIYSVHIPYLIAAVCFKLLRRKKTRIVLFINDLPQYMSDNKSILYLFFKSVEIRLFNLLQKEVDSYIFVTKQMNNLINVDGKPWVLVEGVYDVDIKRNPIELDVDTTSKIVFYSGTLDRRYGLLDLIEAFIDIKQDNFHLWICGEGDLKKEIMRLSDSDSRIQYFGFLEHERVVDLQKRSTVLVNPRKPVGDYTKYSFPLKTLEYLASGSPCIMYKLPGVPIDYYNYVVIPKGESIEALSKAIVEVCEWNSLQRFEFCRMAFDFVKEYKSSRAQFGKIAQLIK